METKEVIVEVVALGKQLLVNGDAQAADEGEAGLESRFLLLSPQQNSWVK